MRVPVNVTTFKSAVVYAYNPQNLLLSYGMAVLASTIAIGVGFYAIFKNGACYDNRVSTFSTAMQSYGVSAN
jgi:ABC-type dipeptide/oligopeptide/nickel transport system permease component